MPEPPHPREFIDRARRLWDEGLSMSQIGNEMGVTKSVIAGISHRNNFPERGSPVGAINSDALVMRVRRLWDEGLTRSQIGERVGKTELAIGKIRYKNGFPRRAPGVRGRRVISPLGKFPSIAAASRETGIPPATIRYRAVRGLLGWRYIDG